MLTFITSVRHPDTAGDYQRVEALLRRTLASIGAQQDRRFRIVVVGNADPSFALPEHAEFVKVGFPAPSFRGSARDDRAGLLRDKGSKLAVALLAARRHSPSHVMVVDADDYVSNRIAGWVNTRPGAPGWYVEHGFMLSAQRGVIRPVDRFNERCGTSLIFRQDLLPLPDIEPLASQDAIIEALGPFTVYELLGSHRVAVTHLREQGTPLEPLPFAGAVYAVGTGENAWGSEMDGLARPVSHGIGAEFGIVPTVSNPKVLASVAQQAVGTLIRRAAALDRVRRFRARGNRVLCPCCGSRFRTFRDFNGPDRMCWGCGSLERHRSAWLYFDRHPELVGPNMTFVHVAPEQMLARRFRELPGVRYLAGDLHGEFGPELLDVTALPFDAGSVDAIVCNHVLEHVPDDTIAMHELRRVLRPGGWAMLLVPDIEAQTTDEEPLISDPAEQLRRFGQRDHVRRYGWDYVDRLRDAGFRVEVDRPAESVPRELVAQCRLEKFGSVEPIFVAHVDATMVGDRAASH